MAQHGRTLGGLHRIIHGQSSDQLLQRLDQNEQVLADICNRLTTSVKIGRRITPAGEWLLDNFYLIEEQIRTARRHLPQGYSRELPRLSHGPSAGYPRVYDLALAAISHGDGRVDSDNLSGFIHSYQQIAELRIGELWAIPIMLRLALIENLRRIAVRMGHNAKERDLADSWATKMVETATNDPKSLILVIADMARSNPPVNSSFVAELSRRLSGQSSALALGLTWIEQRLLETNSSIEQLVRVETQMQAADQLSISNSIGSLRFLGSMNWRDFVEDQCIAEKKLREDPDNVYARMDFGTRDEYRHVVEKLAKKTKTAESLIAQYALDLARAAGSEDDRERHVGFYLIDDGLPALEKLAGTSISSWSGRGKGPLLFGSSIFLLTVLFSIYFVNLANQSKPDGWFLALLAALIVVASSQLALSLVNWLATLLVRSRALPKMDYAAGLPRECRTLVVVPSMLVSADSVEHLVEALEVRFLANNDEQLFFALLTDFVDASEQLRKIDSDLLALACRRIEALNRKYRSDGECVFFLFNRTRLWNPAEGVWMGYERKRGKLAELNAALRTGKFDGFSTVEGDAAALSAVKYVITLDTDTELPRDSARVFVGAMEHPLNRPFFDEKQKRVVRGYGILQPRVGVSLPGASLSHYAAMHGTDAGIDPYTRAVSDVYQDVFRQGSFIGKGIYNIEAFEKALQDRMPENRILSHDLLEGCYVRSGLLSDAELYESYPANYPADVSRHRRWTRGDWQLLAWLLPAVPAMDGKREPNPLTMFLRWKIFDNLRRSLVAPALTGLLILSWTVLSPTWLWTVAVVSVVLLPPVAISLVSLVRKPSDAMLVQHLDTTAKLALNSFEQALFTLVCLPYEALVWLDSIFRTLYRMFITQKHLLAWNPSSEAHRRAPTEFAAICDQMLVAPVTASVVAGFLIVARPEALAVALPLLIGWFCSPAIVWWLGCPRAAGALLLEPGQRAFLRKIARKTWSFFEMFVSQEDHWLPPDNFQEQPLTVVAHRTSPTNMGLSLLANLTARDFGYIQTGEVLSRVQCAISTMRALEKHRGHLYNWYDTQTLRPLPPRYVSTVDSGNLAGHLLTLNSGLSSLLDEQIVDLRVLAGLEDTVGLVVDALEKGTTSPSVVSFCSALALVKASNPLRLLDFKEAMVELQDSATSICEEIPESSFCRVGFDNTSSEASSWAAAAQRQCADAVNELQFMAPWVELAGIEQLVEQFPFVNRIPTLQAVATLYADEKKAIQDELASVNSEQAKEQLQALLKAVAEASRRAAERVSVIQQLIIESTALATFEYEFIFDKSKQLLSIGYNVEERRADASCYDLLASEARLGNFVAIAQGQLPQKSWFSLGRTLTTAAGEPVLFSWSGSMFEYLMPLLVMPTYPGTLLYQTCKAAVDRQIEYGKQRHVPWGISESGYYAVDVNLNYQYRAFGVPGLGLKRGLSQDLVIAPYATVMSLMVAPEAACSNLERLVQEGFLGRYGFYEAIDYTLSRIPRGQTRAIVRSFMAHHQGMSFLSLAYALLNQPMQKRFERDPSLQSAMLLLQERIPKAGGMHLFSTETAEQRIEENGGDDMPMRFFKTAGTATPELQLLSNGRYHVMVTNAGGGYSRWNDLAVNRWREDATCDNRGTFAYVRDANSGHYWSTAFQPTLKSPDSYEAIFSEAKVEFRRRDRDVDTHTEIVVSSEDDIELRRVRVTNRSKQRCVLDVTSYSEVVLANAAHDDQHPAFSNLFVQTEIIPDRQAILCHRRPRSEGDPVAWMFHLLAVHDAETGSLSYETDRLKFIGRGNTPANPQAMQADILSGSQGSVLDPIVSIRCPLKLGPEESATVNLVTGIAESREACLELVEKYHDRLLADRVFDLAWTHSQVVLRQLNATESDGQLYARLANSVIYANQFLRADSATLIKNRRGQSGLWGYSISGDLPIVLLQIKDVENMSLVKQMVQAHAYWRMKGLIVDLVIWNEDRVGYRQLIQEQIMGLVASGVEANLLDKPGGIFVRIADQISQEDRILFQTVARAIIKDSRGTLAEQITRRPLRESKVPRLIPSRVHQDAQRSLQESQRSDLILFNGLGGFTSDGREYVITTTHGYVTPLPWVNVLANPFFGTVVSESAVGYTWLENAHEFRLTPWNNDPVCDPAGEAFYIRDEESGYFWSASPLPARGTTPYTTRHGFGYSVFEHTESGISSEMHVFVALDAPVKVVSLKIRNQSGRSRRISITAYVEWLLGDIKSKTAMHVSTELDPVTGAIFARNYYSSEFPDRVAFLDVDAVNRSSTGDRTELLGRNGNMASPAAMLAERLSGRVGAGLDACGALMVPFELADGEEREVTFKLGIGQDAEDASKLINRFRGGIARLDAFEKLCQYWKRTLGAVQCITPDVSLNMMVNGWLLYQTISSRMWGRSGYYQSGGAFGFRDQLQDAMSLVYAAPELLRKQLLLCSSRQFVEGDVQHWWHPPSGRGVRTRISDDYLWLPLATCRYVSTTGDTGVLDETTPFLSGRAVSPRDDSYFDLPAVSSDSATLYEHCKRAVIHGLRMGAHGIPLMGCGDWNDGMNLVGEKGTGESVWLGFFLYDVLKGFESLASARGDALFAERCRSEAYQLKYNIEQNCWDGNWYHRAYFDDGTPLGSASNDECRIDSISQSWGVISGAANSDRAKQAMDAVYHRLVRKEHQLVQLLDPPFDKSELNPGYIKGYVPGVRENGGQYTHAAVWTAMAFAQVGETARAWELTTMINPVNHALNAASVDVYKVEPYVVAADVYAVSPHAGRGGWSWYTGSAGWMYRLIVESLLGLHLKVDKLRLTPRLPASWSEFKVHYRYRETVYHVTVLQGNGDPESVTVDGVLQRGSEFNLVDDRAEHQVLVRLPSAAD
ncbi:MAG: hypothetical protein K2W95_25220 [Candidatus Obscuribacterales bacterium]|nr:hypothetical protein [Candidatus Obscuribacterales bacterium]